MIDKLAFLFVEGIKNFTRNKLANFICIITILINFTILGAFFVFGYNTENVVNFFRSKYTFEVFLSSDTSLDQAVSLKNEFLDDSLISSVDLIGKEESAKIFHDEFGEDIIQILGYNPLPVSLKVNLYDRGFDSEQVNVLIKKYESNSLVDEIAYQGNYVDSIESRINVFIFIFLILVLLLIFISIQIIGNTTSLSMSNRRDFIEILRYNGASNLFIKTPFIIEAFLQSLVGSLLAFLLVKYGFVIINSYLGINIKIDDYLWAWMIVLSLIVSSYASSKSMKRILL